MWGEFCETEEQLKEKDDNMENTIKELIKETEKKIIKVLVGAYNSGAIDREEQFIKYELDEIKKLLFMRGELDDKLCELIEGDE